MRQLAQALQARGLTVWLDEAELVPGRPWQEAVEGIIQTAHTAAVLVGSDGLGPWEAPEMRACLSQYVKRDLPVIPVLLPDAPREPALPLFLQAFTRVDLRAGLTDDGLNRLEWGITGLKPNGRPAPAVSGTAPSAVDAPAPEPQLDYLGCRHPDFPDQEVFRFRNPLLALHLRNRQSCLDRQQRAQALLTRLAVVLPPHNRGIAELHLVLLDHVGDEDRRRALDGELYYWLDAAHARSAGRELVADLKARRVSPEVVWGAIEQNEGRWPIWRQLVWLEAYGRQPHGVPEGMRGFWLNRLALVLKDAGEFERALGIAEECLAYYRAAEGANSANAGAALDVTASILDDLGEPGPALARHEEALVIARQVLPAGHPDIAKSLNNIGAALNALGRPQDALERLEEALAIRRKALPAGHPDIANSLDNIGAILAALGRPTEAKARWEESLAIHAARAADPAEVIHYCRQYADLAAQHADHPGALYWLDKALDLIPAAPTAGLPDPDALRRELTQQRADLAAAGAGPAPQP
ncbi:toll/interleukin-1 receptor domain-containing protein [uncultured Thiodictyon sp.]|uniref:toll/interleukin-1 receptor domain-containing protein n=1 Tax=uncultured Thiodictyon sp. TaxID=1846217 RepID=UPI0025EB3C94|nr:toll/interleukin-1 receptor domain-containing protein [uncultured Thiodictyon sp.]